MWHSSHDKHPSSDQDIWFDLIRCFLQLGVIPSLLSYIVNSKLFVLLQPGQTHKHLRWSAPIKKSAGNVPCSSINHRWGQIDDAQCQHRTYKVESAVTSLLSKRDWLFSGKYFWWFCIKLTTLLSPFSRDKWKHNQQNRIRALNGSVRCQLSLSNLIFQSCKILES